MEKQQHTGVGDADQSSAEKKREGRPGVVAAAPPRTLHLHPCSRPHVLSYFPLTIFLTNRDSTSRKIRKWRGERQKMPLVSVSEIFIQPQVLY